MSSPKQIAEIYVSAGNGKTRIKPGRMFVLACFAGAFIALGGLASQVASCTIPNPSVAKIISGLVFPIGLMMVVCGGAELFTGNSLIIIPIIEKRGKVGPLLTNWGIVFLGNLVGSVAIALMAVYGHTLSLYNGELAKMVVATAVTKVHLSFLDAFIRGILCNFMVCLAVWISFGAGQDMAGKILGLALPVFLFVLCGFEHCVANMYFIPAGMFASLEYGIQAEGLNVLSFLYGNLLPVVLGNIIGGAVLVGLGYWYAYLKLEK